MATIYKPRTAHITTTFLKPRNGNFIHDPKMASYKMLVYGMSCHVQKMTREAMNLITQNVDYKNKTGLYRNVMPIRYELRKLHDTFIFIETRELDGVVDTLKDRYDDCGDCLRKIAQPFEERVFNEFMRLNADLNHSEIKLLATIDTALMFGYSYTKSVVTAVAQIMPAAESSIKARAQYVNMFVKRLESLRQTLQKPLQA